MTYRSEKGDGCSEEEQGAKREEVGEERRGVKGSEGEKARRGRMVGGKWVSWAVLVRYSAVAVAGYWAVSKVEGSKKGSRSRPTIR